MVSRLRTELSTEGDNHVEAIAAHRDHVLPAASAGRPVADEPLMAPNAAVPRWLVACHSAMAESTRETAQNTGTDADATAICALRFIAQDVLLLRTKPPERFHELPLLTSYDVEEMADSGSEIQAWISEHTAIDSA